MVLLFCHWGVGVCECIRGSCIMRLSSALSLFCYLPRLESSFILALANENSVFYLQMVINSIMFGMEK